MVETWSHILRPDEPTWGMEVAETPSGFMTRIRVLRGGVLVWAEINHGPNAEYSGKIPPLFVPSIDGENKAGEMLQESENHRHDLRYWRRAKEMKEGSTLIRDVIRQEEEALEWVANRSVFGPALTKQRNGYSRDTTHREWNEERARRTGKRSFATNG
jgi:hypothetical protein